jgi:hypothetical protein
MTKPHRATPDDWAQQKDWANRSVTSASSCIIELRDRIEALEAAQQPPQDRLDRLIAIDRDAPAGSLVERVAPTDEELEQFLFDNYRSAIEFACDTKAEGDIVVDNHIAFARAALARYGTPANQPVPVSERPWEREGWCDAEGQCWWFHKATRHTNAGWIPATHEDIELVGAEFFSHSLPHNALPTPEANQ